MADEYVENGIPFLRSLNVKRFRFNSDDLKYISEDFHRKIKKSTLWPGDVVIVRTGVPGASCVIPKSLNEANCSDLVIIRCGPKLDPYFASYYINSITASHINGKLVGAIQQHFNIGEAKQIAFPDIGLSHQKRISSVLSALDAKIEINNAINAELEGMAKLLYDYWFVQFDFPLTAAQAASLGRPELEGHPYKSSGGPMVHNTTLNRPIPAGWNAVELQDIAQITMGQSPPGESYNDHAEGELFFQGSTDFGWRFPEPRQYTTAATRIAKKGDILLSVRAPVGTLNIAPFKCAIGRGLSALRSKDGHDAFLFFVMQSFKQIFDRRNGDGTTFGSINRDDLRSLKLVLPPKELIQKYEDLAAKNNEMIFINHQQNQELTALRDWLLPMLMNGQVTVG